MGTIQRRRKVWAVWLWLGLAAFGLPALACSVGQEEEQWLPENPRQYTAETAPVEVYILIDREGNMVDFGQPYAYGANASLRYVLRFWDVGQLGGADKGAAPIHKAYTPHTITGIQVDIESGLSEAERAEVYARTSFPTTEVKWADLTYTGGTAGYFSGTNPDTGEEIWGFLEWREEQFEMHAVFTRDIQQDYKVIDDEPCYNWP